MKKKIFRNSKQLEGIKFWVSHWIDWFKKSSFQLAIASNQEINWDDVNEINIITVLIELEEYFSLLMTYMAQRKNNPDAHVSTLPLDMMTSKNFKADPIAIDAPNAGDVPSEDETQADDEIVTNPAEKYRKFQELAQRGFFDKKGGK